MAEVPYVATQTGFRRAGNFSRLLQARRRIADGHTHQHPQTLEDTLRHVGVKKVLVPSVPQTLVLWERRRNYARVPAADVAVLDCHIVLPDLDSVVLLCKDLHRLPRRAPGRRHTVVFQTDATNDGSDYAPGEEQSSSDEEPASEEVVPKAPPVPTPQPATPGAAATSKACAKPPQPKRRAPARRPQQRLKAAARRRQRRLQGVAPRVCWL